MESIRNIFDQCFFRIRKVKIIIHLTVGAFTCISADSEYGNISFISLCDKQIRR